MWNCCQVHIPKVLQYLNRTIIHHIHDMMCGNNCVCYAVFKSWIIVFSPLNFIPCWHDKVRRQLIVVWFWIRSPFRCLQFICELIILLTLWEDGFIFPTKPLLTFAPFNSGSHTCLSSHHLAVTINPQKKSSCPSPWCSRRMAQWT